MANFAIPTASSPATRVIDPLGRFAEGYKVGAVVGDRYNERKLGEAVSAIPEKTTTETVAPTEQTAMLAEQTKEFADETGALPESEQQAQESTKKTKRMTTRDWASYRSNALKRAGKLGMEAVAKTDELVTRQQLEGFQDAGRTAVQALQSGDMAAAKEALEDAYSYYPDGMTPDIRVVKGPDGSPQLVASGYDETTNEYRGSMVMTPSVIGSFMEMTADPVKFSAMTRDRQMLDRDYDLKKAREAREKSEGEAADKRGNRAIAVQEQQAAIAANRAAAERKLDPLCKQQMEADITRTKAQAGYEARRTSGRGTSSRNYADLTAYERGKMMGELEDRIMTMEQFTPAKDNATYAEHMRRLHNARLELDAVTNSEYSPSAIPQSNAAPLPPGVPAGTKKSASDGNYYAADGRVFDGTGTQIGSWK